MATRLRAFKNEKGERLKSLADIYQYLSATVKMRRSVEKFFNGKNEVNPTNVIKYITTGRAPNGAEFKKLVTLCEEEGLFIDIDPTAYGKMASMELPDEEKAGKIIHVLGMASRDIMREASYITKIFFTEENLQELYEYKCNADKGMMKVYGVGFVTAAIVGGVIFGISRKKANEKDPDALPEHCDDEEYDEDIDDDDFTPVEVGDESDI